MRNIVYCGVRNTVQLFRILASFAAAGGVSQAAISSVQVLGATNVQAALSFQAPADVPCRLEASEHSNYQPLVNDVNPALFAGADLDSRNGNVVDSGSRIFVLGSRAVDQASDRKWYSRALQTDTVHYFRIRCGGDTATGSFRTANIPVGITSSWAIPQDPVTGNFRWPSTDNDDRNQSIIDPNYGTLIRRVSVPGDVPQLSPSGQSFASAAGTSWTTPQGSLKNDSQSASYTGSGKDWLILTDPGIELSVFYEGALSIDFVKVNVRGSSAGSTPQDRTVEICLTIDSASCHGDIRTIVLDSAESVKSAGTAPGVDTWGDTLWTYDVSSRVNKKFGVMLRPAKAGSPISIQWATMDMALSEIAGMPTAGFFKTCSSQKSNGGYHCSYPGAGGSNPNYIFWIQPETGETRFLGRVIANGWGAGSPAFCLVQNALWDPTDPNVYYCIGNGADGKQVLLKGTYSGGDTQVPAGSNIAMSWVNLTPSPYTVDILLKNFNNDFDPSKHFCNLSHLTNQYMIIKCLSGGQDSAGWVAALDLGNKQPIGAGGTGRIVAASKTYAAPSSRWCGVHSLEPIADINWIGFNPQFLRDDSGNLGFSSTLASPVPASNGRFTIQVSGEPSPALTDAAAGDVFVLSGASSSDTIQIVQKNSSTEWFIERKATGNPAALAPGLKLYAYCSAYFGTPNAPTVYWDFLSNPDGRDASGKFAVRENILAGSHIVQRGDYRLQAWWTDGFEIVTPGAPKSWNKPLSYIIETNPKFNDKRVWQGLSEPYSGLEGYQTHPSYENYLAQAPGRGNWFTDIIPFIGSAKLHGGVSAVAGASQVYKVPNKTLHPGTFPPFARCGGRQLKNVSPGPIADKDVYSFCTGSGCFSGAADTDVFVNCPAPVSAKSICSENYFGDESSVCVSELSAYGQSIGQYYFDQSGRRSRVLTNGFMAWHAPRTFMLLDSASPLPDGSWIVFPSFANNARRDLYMVKVPAQPPFPVDTSAGSNRVNVTIVVTPPADTRFQNAALQFGPDSKLEGATGSQACSNASPCSITVSAKPMELIFAKPVYLDANNKKIGEGLITVQAALVGQETKQPPQVNVGGVVNAASFQLPIAPGALVSVLGQSFSGCAGELAKSLPLTDNLCGTQVLFNGKPGPMYYASGSQLTALIPNSIVPGQDLKVAVNSSGTMSNEIVIAGTSVLGSAPAIFSYSLAGDVTRAVIQGQDGILIGPKDPDVLTRSLRPGELGVVYSNALGSTDPSVGDGQASPLEPLARTAQPVEVLINGVPQQVLFSGMVPGSVGLYQVNFVLGTDLQPSSSGSAEIALRINGVMSPVLLTNIAPN